VQLDHLGIEGCLLASELILALSCPPLNVDLSGADSHLLLLLVGILLIGEELHFWLGCHHPHRDLRGSLESRSILWNWCVDGRVC
jgi:hypothetical protein